MDFSKTHHSLVPQSERARYLPGAGLSIYPRVFLMSLILHHFPGGRYRKASRVKAQSEPVMELSADTLLIYTVYGRIFGQL